MPAGGTAGRAVASNRRRPQCFRPGSARLGAGTARANFFAPTRINRDRTGSTHHHILVKMERAMTDQIIHDDPNGPDLRRRGFMKCMAWAGTGLVWTVVGGVPKSLGLGGEALAAPADGFTFVQISDSHIGFNKEANPDPNSTLQAALDRIAKLPKKPAMLLHTGDVTHLSKPEEFDTADQILKSAKLDAHYVPGEHDVIGDDGKQFFARFAKEATQGGWYSFDHGGVHFVALINVMGFK